MAMAEFYKEFERLSPEQQEMFKAIMELLNSGDNLNFKTEIRSPESHTAFDVFGEYCHDIGQEDASKYIKLFSRVLKEQNVSRNREGRKELERILSSAIQTLRERSLSDKALGKHGE